MTRPAARALRLDPRLQPQAYRPVFKQFGRLHVPGFLEARDARDLVGHLQTSVDWRRTFHADGMDHDVLLRELEELDSSERAQIEESFRAGARDSFRYMFDSFRISNELRNGRPADPWLTSAFELVNSEAFLNFVRELTGDPRPVCADAIATRYLPGHFLTAHDDEAPNEHRLFAYVLNLTTRWRADWGGLLLFLDEEDHVAEGYTPAFNALNIFSVPQRHAVSLVAPFAGEPRYAVTGWIRSRHPEPPSPQDA